MQCISLQYNNLNNWYNSIYSVNYCRQLNNFHLFSYLFWFFFYKLKLTNCYHFILMYKIVLNYYNLILYYNTNNLNYFSFFYLSKLQRRDLAFFKLKFSKFMYSYYFTTFFIMFDSKRISKVEFDKMGLLNQTNNFYVMLNSNLNIYSFYLYLALLVNY